MALQRDDRYPGRFDNATSDYPQGAFKNRTSPTAKDGSYIERDWANDWAGFFGRLMKVAGFTANGTVDTANVSQYYDALLVAIKAATPAWIVEWKQNNDDTTGGVMAFAHANIPAGWLVADGSPVSRDVYSRLFSKIGTTYGAGDGATTFNLPDLRGEFIRGWDNNRGVDNNRSLGTSQSDSFKSHDHSGNTGNDTHSHTGNTTNDTHNHGINTGVGGGDVGTKIQGDEAGSDSTKFTDSDTHNHNLNINSDTHNHTIPPEGGTETRPRNIAFMYCIKT